MLLTSDFGVGDRLRMNGQLQRSTAGLTLTPGLCAASAFVPMEAWVAARWVYAPSHHPLFVNQLA